VTATALSVVLACIVRVVPVELDVGPETPLLELPELDSLAIADLIAAAEKALGVELPAEQIVPASFASPQALAQAFEGAMTAATAAPSFSALLPCVEANVELLLRNAGVRDVLTVLGGPCALEAEPPARLELRPLQLERWISRQTGLELRRTTGLDSAAAVECLREALDGGGVPALVFADAFSVPWNPYAGHEHHEHAFVVDAWDEAGERLHVVDAYTNATRWGRATPSERWTPARELFASLAPPPGRGIEVAQLAGATRAAVDGPGAIVRGNVMAYEGSRARGAGVERLAEHLDEGADGERLRWLSLATWLAARSRALHALWWRRCERELLASSAIALFADEVVVPAWEAAQTAMYLASRRVEAGRGCPPHAHLSLADAAAADREWFARMRAWVERGGAR
jgi:acyl carrier protein